MTPKPELETRSFEVKVEIDAPPEAVWKAVAEAEGIANWFAPDVKVDPGVGGSISVSWGPGMEGSMKIEAWEPNQHLGLAEYREKPYGCGPDSATTGDGVAHRIATDYFIEAKQGGGTILRLVHSGFGASADWDAEIESLSRGWPTFFRVMKHGLERHPGKPARSLTIVAKSALTPEETWQRLMGPAGIRQNAELQYGNILIEGERRFAAVISNLDDALCSLVCEGTPGQPGAFVYWMITVYSMPSERADAIQSKWSSFVQELVAS